MSTYDSSTAYDTSRRYDGLIARIRNRIASLLGLIRTTEQRPSRTVTEVGLKRTIEHG